jgi:hypothetical protein
VYGGSAGVSAVTALAPPALLHEPRHVFSCCHVARGDGGVSLADSLHPGPIAQQFQCCFKGLQVFSRYKHDVVAPVSRDVDAFMRAIHLVRDLGEMSFDLREWKGAHGLGF